MDIHFEPALPMEVLTAFNETIRREFADCTTLWQQALDFEVLEGGAGVARHEASTAPIGYRLSDKSRVLIVRTTGFTYSRLPPYKDWDELRESAKRLWELFLGMARPETVNRIAVRYINVLPLPIQTEDFSVFLKAAPVVPTGLPQGLASFLQRVVMIDPQGNRQAIVTQAMEASQPTDGRVQIILDIDTFRSRRIGGGSPEVWSGLDSLRDFKNDIFFEHITERTAELFQ